MQAASLFGYQFSPSVDWVKLVALTGTRGQPPVLWEGAPETSQRDIERAIARNPSVVEWLYRKKLVKNRRAWIRVQLDGYRGGKRIESHALEQIRLTLHGPRRAKFTNDEVVLRAFDLTERVLELLQELLKDRDHVIGRLVERGLNPPAAQASAESARSAARDSIAESLPEILRMAQAIRRFKE